MEEPIINTEAPFLLKVEPVPFEDQIREVEQRVETVEEKVDNVEEKLLDTHKRVDQLRPEVVKSPEPTPVEVVVKEDNDIQFI